MPPKGYKPKKKKTAYTPPDRAKKRKAEAYNRASNRAGTQAGARNQWKPQTAYQKAQAGRRSTFSNVTGSLQQAFNTARNSFSGALQSAPEYGRSFMNQLYAGVGSQKRLQGEPHPRPQGQPHQMQQKPQQQKRPPVLINQQMIDNAKKYRPDWLTQDVYDKYDAGRKKQKEVAAYYDEYGLLPPDTRNKETGAAYSSPSSYYPSSFAGYTPSSYGGGAGSGGGGGAQPQLAQFSRQPSRAQLPRWMAPLTSWRIP